MVKFLPFSIVIFTILCFACVLNALEDNLESSNGNSSNDTAEAVSPTSTNRPSSGRVRSSAWSREEKDEEPKLKTEGDKNKEEDVSLLDDESSLWNMKNLFRYVVSLLYDVNQSSDGSGNKALDNLQIKMQNLGNNYLSEKSDNNMKGEMRNSANGDALDKSLNEVKMQNRSNNHPLNNGQLIKNSKIKTQNFIDEDIMNKPENTIKTQTQNLPNTDSLNKSEDDRETQNSAYNNNTSSKSSNDEKVQKSPNTDFIENKEATGNSKSKTQSPVDNESANKPKDNKKTEKQSPDTLTKPASDGYKQNSVIGTLNESLSNGEMQKSSNNNSPESAQLTETSKSNKQSSAIKNHSNESVQNSKNNKTQNPSSESLKLESVSALINDKPKEEVAKIIFKDYDRSTDNTSDEEVDEYEDDNEEEDEDEVDDNEEGEEDENDMDDNETEDDNMNETINKNDTKDKDGTDDNIKENANDDVRNYGTGNKNPPAEVVDTKANDPSIKLPKFIIKAIQNQRNFSEAQPSKILLDSNDNAAHEAAESHNMTNEGKPISEFQLSSNEFIDDYINIPQEKTPEKKNEQSSNADLLIPDETYSKSIVIPMQIPISKNNSEEDNSFLYATPSVNENVKDQTIPFNQPQNTVDNSLWDINASPFPNESKKDSNPNKDIVTEFITENVKHVPTSAGKPVIPEKLFPFQEKSYSDDLQNTFAIPQENYNAFTKAATLNFQNMDLSDRTPHNDISATHIYRSEVPYQTFPYKPIPIGNEGYANDPYENFNFQDEKYPSINNEKNPQFEQHQPIILQQDAFPNIQPISDQGSSIRPEEMTYFTNYRPEMPVTMQNTGNANQNMEMFPNNFPFDALQTNPSFSEIYNEDSLLTGVENSMDTFMYPDHLETAKPENQINNQQTANFQNQPDNLPFQDNFSQQQALFPETDVKKTFVENEMHNKPLPRRNNMTSEIFLPYDESRNAEFQKSQPDANNSKGLPRNSFTPVTPQNIETNSPVKSSKPLIYEPQKRLNFNESVGQEQETSSFDSDSIYNDSSEDHGPDYDEDESEEYATRSDETDTEQNEGESNFASENKYEFEDSEEEDYYSDKNDEDYYTDEVDDDDYAAENEEDDYSDENDADDYADENGEDDNSDESNEDDYAEKNNYGGEETKSDGKAKKSKSMITPDKRTHDNTITSPKPIKQATSNKQNHGKTQPSKSQINNNDDVILENSQSHSSTNEGNSSPGSESTNGGFNDDYTKDHLDAKPKKENKRMKPVGTTNDVTQFITQKPPSNEGDGATKPQETSNGQNKSVSSKQGENVNTILEYIYKHSNSPLFKGVRDENES